MADNTDGIVLSFLRSAGVELPEKATSLGELDTDALVAACVHCLHVIAQANGDEQRLPEKLSKNPGARFRQCTGLATAITKLGFAGEVGFNSFLYPSEAETRKLLLFLIDQMPKGGDGDGDGDMVTGAVSFDHQMQQALVRGLEQPWAPPSWLPKRVSRAERRAHLRSAVALSALGAARRAERQAALEERLQSLSHDAADVASGPSRSGGFGSQDAFGGGSGGSRGTAHDARGAFANSVRFAHEGASAADDTPLTGTGESAPSETAAQRAERAERERLQAAQAELDSLLAAIDEQRQILESANAAAATVSATVAELEEQAKANEEEEAKRNAGNAVRRKALELAVDPVGSRARLDEAKKKATATMLALVEEWEGIRGPLLRQLEAAKRKRQERRDGAAAKMARVKELRGEMRAMVTELQERDETNARLTKEMGKAKGAARSTYTDRIMDVVRNLRKQKLGIETILADIRESQKEVNRLSETLQRSFRAADEVIFRDAVKSAASKQCYKALATMHERFGRLVEYVQDIANRTTEDNELQAKVNELSARNIPEAIERVSADLKEIKAENAKLSAQKAQ